MLTRIVISLISLSFVVTALVVMPGVRPALAQAAGAPIIIVIDTQRILRESEAVRSIQEQVGEQRNAYQNALKEKERRFARKTRS